MGPRLVFISTRGFWANAVAQVSSRERASDAASFMRVLRQVAGAGAPARTTGSGGAFVDDAPAAAFVDPVLALLHHVGKAARLVLLVEGHDHHRLFARVAEDAD